MKFNKIIEILHEINYEYFVIVDMLIFDVSSGKNLVRVKERFNNKAWHNYKTNGNYPISE